MARPERLVLHGGIVLTGPSWVPRSADLLVEGDVIAAIDDPGVFDGADARREELTGCLVVPGFVNAHTHSHTLVARGVARRWTLEVSLLNASWMGADRCRELTRLCALLAGAECLASGATGLFDLTAAGAIPDRDTIDSITEAYSTLGIRARIAPMVSDRSVHEAVPVIGACCGAGPAGAPTDAVVAACARLLDHPPGDRRVGLGLAPTIPTHCTTELMTGLRRLADGHGVPIHLHLAESKPQALSGRDRYRRSITAELAAIGMLDGPVTAAHAIWVDETDIGLLADAAASVVTVPGSNLRLGSGVAPVASLLAAGVGVGIGTDGANSADLLDVHDAVRLTNLLPRITTAEPSEWLSVEDTLDAATVGGARACGWSDTGRLVPGAQADLTAFDLSAAGFSPRNDLANQLLTAARAADVRHVMVAGRFRLRDRLVPGVDLAAARSRFCELTEEFLTGVRALRDLASRQAARSEQELGRLRRAPVEPERLLRWPR